MSRPGRSKPFLRLIGEHSCFQNTILRAQPLVADAEILVIGGALDREVICLQMAEIGVETRLLLEPSGRDTAAAIGAAAGWVAQRNASAIVAILSADHHIPDAAAFQDAIRATFVSASEGAIITLGVPPTHASSAYGYIHPGPESAVVKSVTNFEEKPDPERARHLVENGALWNSGVFVGKADTFVAELQRLAPSVAEVVRRALDDVIYEGSAALLSASFSEAPRIAFDRAVMEKTDRARVVKVAFEWSDLGSWDAVLAASPRDEKGNSLGQAGQAIDAHNVLVRAPSGMKVSVVGTSNVAVVVEPDAILVCNLEQAQSVREIGHPAVLAAAFPTLDAAAIGLDLWLRTAALPLWATVGVDPANGAFRDALTWDGHVSDPHRRTRVQARQAFVFASAPIDGLEGPWAVVGATGLDVLLRTSRRPDGLFASIVSHSDAQADPDARLYENAFVLLALSARYRQGRDATYGALARGLRDRLQAFGHLQGGYREDDGHPFQANASMHLFEATLAWEQVDDDPAWSTLSDSLAELAMSHFVDGATGVLSEYFDERWQRLTGTEGLLEPGHQFEWAWLLARWGDARNDPRGRDMAQRLFAAGRTGFDGHRGVVVNALWDDLSVRDAGARLWPQCEHLKAALILGETDAALQAANSLALYLDVPARGVWRERMRADGSFIEEPAPATSLYHLYLAIRELTRHPPKSC